MTIHEAHKTIAKHLDIAPYQYIDSFWIFDEACVKERMYEGKVSLSVSISSSKSPLSIEIYFDNIEIERVETLNRYWIYFFSDGVRVGAYLVDLELKGWRALFFHSGEYKQR